MNGTAWEELAGKRLARSALLESAETDICSRSKITRDLQPVTKLLRLTFSSSKIGCISLFQVGGSAVSTDIQYLFSVVSQTIPQLSIGILI